MPLPQVPNPTNQTSFAHALADIAADQALLATDALLLHKSGVEAPILTKLSAEIALYLYDIQHNNIQGAEKLLSFNGSSYSGCIADDLGHYVTALGSQVGLAGVASVQAGDLICDLYALHPTV